MATDVSSVYSSLFTFLHQGNACDAHNVDRLNQNGITHILNCTPDLSCCWENKYQYMRIAVLDLTSQNIRQYFNRAIDFIG
jgi:hypothetical protein